MTAPNPQPEPANWQALYSSSDSRWRDLERTGGFLLPIALLIFLATMYVIAGYTYIHMEEWIPENITRFSYSLYMFRLMITLLAPLFATIVGLVFIFRQSQIFIRTFYQPKEDEKIGALLSRKLIGVIPFPPPLNTVFKYPFLVVRKPVLDDSHWARWFGGPANLVVYEGIALYLERGNSFSRVVGPGLPPAFLERYERIKEVVDLRPQTRIGEVMPWTKDGIRVKLTIRAECQISASPEAVARSSKFRFPFDPGAVKTAVERMTVRATAEGEIYESSWLDGAWGTITGAINAYVAGHTLDELFIDPHVNGQASVGSSGNNFSNNIGQILSHKIMEEELEKIKKGLGQNGVSVGNFQITKVQMPKEVLELRAKYWESDKQRIAALRTSRAEADRIRIREQAHAEAQRAMLQAITQRLEKIDPSNLTEPLILSLSGIIDQGLDDPLVRPMIAKESFDVLNRVRKMLKEGF